MTTVFDVAKYILNKLEPMSAMKLQKMVYYSQAWYATWEGEALFPERIEAWANGPVSPDLYRLHRGKLQLRSRDLAHFGDARKIRGDHARAIDAVIKFYGEMKPFELSTLTHLEDPWKNARGTLSPGDRGNNPITHGAMVEYYSSIS